MKTGLKDWSGTGIFPETGILVFLSRFGIVKIKNAGM